MATREDIVEIRKEIQDLFTENDVKLTAKEIDEKLNKLIIDFKVPVNEAKMNVVKSFNKAHNLEVKAGGTSSDALISTLKDGQWANLSVIVKQIWDANHESIGQTGLVADPTGAITFTAWASAGVPDMEEGKSYKLSNIVINRYNDKLQVSMNKTSSIEELDEDIVAGSLDVTITGAIVAINNGSGYIKRCPECNKAIAKGACTEHGKITKDTIPDLRVMAVLDDGIAATTIHLNRSLTEQITGTTLEQCEAVIAEAMDQSVILDQFRKQLIGKYFTVTGPNFNNLLAKEIEEITEIDTDVTAELVTKTQEV